MPTASKSSRVESIGSSTRIEGSKLSDRDADARPMAVSDGPARPRPSRSRRRPDGRCLRVKPEFSGCEFSARFAE